MPVLKRLALTCLLLALPLAPLFADEKGADEKGTDENMPHVRLSTTLGDIVLELDPVNAPLSVENFISYMQEGAYDGTIFHRVIDGFMIQGGGFTRDFIKAPTREPIQNEANNGLKNLTGTVAMARTNHPHSATSQFFINVVDNDFLNHRSETLRGWGYTVFGKVVEGMDVVQQIQRSATTKREVPGAPGSRPVVFNDVPRTTIEINKVVLDSFSYQQSLQPSLQPSPSVMPEQPPAAPLFNRQ